MQNYKLTPGKLGRKAVQAYRRVETAFVENFLEADGSLKTGGMERPVTDAYRRVEKAVVGGYRKVEKAFVDAFLEPTDSQEHR